MPSLIGLPMELVTAICDEVDDKDILNIRLSCQGLELITRNIFLKRCAKNLARPTIALTPSALRVLIELSESERLRYHVTGLVVCTGQLALWPAQEGTGYLDPDLIRRLSEETERRERRAIAKLLADQDHMNSLGMASDMLSIALRRLPNCERITIIHEGVDGGILWLGRTHICDATGNSYVDRRLCTRPTSNGLASTFRTIARAFIASGKTLRTMEVDHDSYAGIEMQELLVMILSSLDVASPLLKDLQELKLERLNIWKTDSLRQVLKCVPNLHTLRFVYCRVEPSRDLSTVLVPKYLPELRCLEVAGVKMNTEQMADFVQLLTSLRESLRELTLQGLDVTSLDDWKTLLISIADLLLTRIEIGFLCGIFRVPTVCLESSLCRLKKGTCYLYRAVSGNIPRDVPNWIDHLHAL